MIYDVAIIGGGIAGLALAIDLKMRGYHVIVIEKGNYPRHKVCGEYISMESQSYLYKLCPAMADLALPVITDFMLTSVRTKTFTTKLSLGGFGISRYLLEELLFKEAEKKGVVFMLGSKAIETKIENETSCVTTNNGDVRALLVCNSSGRKSNFETKDKIVGKSEVNYIGIKYHIKLKRNPGLIEIHNFPGGYCGVSNIEEGKTCVCYIVNSKFLRKVNNSIPELEKTVLFKNARLQKIFTEAEFIFKEPSTISGINFRIKKPIANMSFSLGDAAGSTAPITGNGMSMGLRSASVLATEIDAWFSEIITREQLSGNYGSFWKKEFSTRIKLSRHFQKLAEYPPLTTVTIGLFNTFPFLAKTVIKQTHGKPF